MTKWLPNGLSAARLLVSPYLCFLLWRGQYRLALIVLLLAALTDGLDGYFARKLKAQSRFGEVLDPIADKVLMGGAFLTLAFSSAIEPWLASVVIGRDVLILLVAAGALALGNAAPPISAIGVGQAEYWNPDRIRRGVDGDARWPAAQVPGGDPQMGHCRDDHLEWDCIMVGWHGVVPSIIEVSP